MILLFRYFALLTCTAFLVSCSSEVSRKTALVSEKKQENLKSDYNKKNRNDILEHFAGGFSYKKNAEGISEVSSDRRSMFEGRQFNSNTSNNNNLEKKSFATKSFEKTMADAARKTFDTKEWRDSRKLNEMTMDTPEFINRAEAFNTKKWKQTEQDFETKPVAPQWQEAWEGAKNYQTNNSDYVSERRNRVAPPPVYSLKEYQVKTIEETRAMMGRSD